MPHYFLDLVATCSIPALGVEPGDFVRYRPGSASHHWTVVRKRDFDFGTVLCAMNEGELIPLDIKPADELPSEPREPAASLRAPSPRHESSARPHPALRVLRQG